MNIILWVIGSMLAAVGLTDIIARAVCRMSAPKKEDGIYRVIRLKKDSLLIEERMRYELLCLSWSAQRQSGKLIFIDGGLSGDDRLLSERLLKDFDGAMLCAPGELADILS